MPTPQIVSTRNGISSVTGYREDLVPGDVVGLSLSNTVGITNAKWELVGRPEGSAAGGAGPEPVLLANALTAAFTVDADSGSFRRDGTYKVQVTLNPGAPGSVRVTAIVCRLSGFTVPGPTLSTRSLRKLGGFEALEDTSIITIIQGWATQLNRWLDAILGILIGGGGGGGGSGESFSDVGPATADASNTEIVVWQFTFNGATHPSGSLAATFSFQAKTTGGTATFRLYVGGTEVERFSPPSGGTLIGSPQTTTSPTYTPVGLSGSFTNPLATVEVQITMQSPVGQTSSAKEVNGRITP